VPPTGVGSLAQPKIPIASHGGVNMAIQSATPENIRDAMRRFDAEMRNMPDWLDWEDKKTHKFAFHENDRLYPMKEIISLATGTPKDEFSGGEEAIRYALKLGFDVEALRLPSEPEVRLALHDLLLERYPETLSPSQCYTVLADEFHLSQSQRSLALESDGRNHWENRVHWARQKLVEEDILDPTEHGVWKLKSHSRPRYWVEKVIVKGRPDRESGPDSLGRSLWSPERDKRGADIYRNMRLVEPGDIVFHLIDNEKISGVSIAAERASPKFTGISGTEWADRPCYRIELRDYVELSPPIHRRQFLEDPDREEEIKDILNHGGHLFFNSKFDLNQGAYLTEAPKILVEMFDDIYRINSGRGLPYIPGVTTASMTHFNEGRLRASILLFKWLYGEDGFASELYLEEERNYKLDLVREWRSKVSDETLEQAISDSSSIDFANDLGQLFTKTNLLPWRYADAVRMFSDVEAARSFLTALQNLLFSADTMRPDIDAFNNALMSRYKTTLNETAIKPATHCIPSLALWLTYPEQHFFVRPELYNRASRILIGSVAEGQGEVMTTDYYLSAVDFAKTLREQIAELNPRDMIDVQGFCFGVFNQSRVWFGGKSYGGSRDMLPEFVARKIYAIGFARRPEIAELFKDVPSLDKESRAARRTELESACASGNDAERKALLSFFDLLSAPGSVLLAKSSWFDRGLQQSLLRISGVCVTGKHGSYDENIGHQISVDWRSTLDHTVEARDYYSDLAHTLNVHPLEKALDIIALDPPRAKPSKPTETVEAEEIEESEGEEPVALPVQPAYTIDDFARDTGFKVSTITGWQNRLLRKQQVVFQGPPGTGKTFVAERLARLLVSETTGFLDVVQFHPSYSYEDFMQGIRPQVISGGLTYQIEPGRFLDFCRKAEQRVDGSPCVLIIDELNRANLSRVFGELMYLLEYRDKKIPLSIGGEEFQIPENVFVIGTMNTADRSIALVDHALRRRFSFIYLGPAYDVLQQRLQRDGLPANSLLSVLQAINREIDDRNFEIGISFFMSDGNNLRIALEEIWKGEIEPYLEEYFYDQPKKVDAFRWDSLVGSELQDWG